MSPRAWQRVGGEMGREVGWMGEMEGWMGGMGVLSHHYTTSTSYYLGYHSATATKGISHRIRTIFRQSSEAEYKKSDC